MQVRAAHTRRRFRCILRGCEGRSRRKDSNDKCLNAGTSGLNQSCSFLDGRHVASTWLASPG